MHFPRQKSKNSSYTFLYIFLRKEKYIIIKKKLSVNLKHFYISIKINFGFIVFNLIFRVQSFQLHYGQRRNVMISKYSYDVIN